MSQSSEHGTSSGGLNTGGNLSESSFLEAYLGWSLVTQISQMTQIFLLCCLFVPQISRNSTDLCPMRAGISQMMQMTQIFFAAHLSPITIYWKKSGKLLIAIGIACVTDG